MIPLSRAESCLGGFRADWALFSRAGGYIFPFRARKDTSFLRRKLPRRIPGGKGCQFPRRQLHFSFQRQKRYLIPAQNGATKNSGRKKQPVPAQAATFFLSAPEKIPHSRAGGDIFPFRARKDTSFPRRTVTRRIPGGKGCIFQRRENNMCRGEKIFLIFTFYYL